MGAVYSRDVERERGCIQNRVPSKITQVYDRTDVGITLRLIVGEHIMKREGMEQCDIHQHGHY
jgi:hypothetical protein